MPAITIPKLALPGFTALSKMPIAVGKKFAEFLKYSPVGIKMDQVNEFLQTLDIQSDQSRAIVQTIITFRGLLEESPNLEETAKNLTESYKEKTKNSLDTALLGKLSDQEEQVLFENLKQIFESSKSLKLTLKANRLLSEDYAVYSSSSIITDIRLVFDDDLAEKDRNGVIVHRLNIEYISPSDSNSLFVSMTNDDLKELKAAIDRALQKEEVIIKDYNSTIHFIGSSLK